MATDKALSTMLKAMPKEAAASLGKQFAGMDVLKLGKVRAFPRGIPFPDEWVVSVIPHDAAGAKRLIDALVARPGRASFEVFPYGIIDPEIGRIDIRVGP